MTDPDFRALAQPAQELSQLSDGYHTFAELYEHRHALVLCLMKAKPKCFWFSRRHNDGELCFGGDEWFIVGGTLPGGEPITYHLPARLWKTAQATGAAEQKVGDPWDGHSAADVVQRLLAWAEPPMTDPTNRLPLWQVMDIAKEQALERDDQCHEAFMYAAELRAIADWLVPEEPMIVEGGRSYEQAWLVSERERLRRLLLDEADRAEAAAVYEQAIERNHMRKNRGTTTNS
jgi:hypothetical protein